MNATLRPLHERIRDLREGQGLSQPELFRLTEGVGLDTIRGVETPPGKARHRYPRPAILAAILKALGEDPDDWPEYQLAQAREMLDEREVGLDEALANLQAIEARSRQNELVALSRRTKQVLAAPGAGKTSVSAAAARTRDAQGAKAESSQVRASGKRRSARSTVQ